MVKQRQNKLTEAEIEAMLQEDDISDIKLFDEGLDDEIEELETSFDRETYDYDYEVEDDYSIDEEVQPATQLNDCISFDAIKLILPLTEAEYVEFDVRRDCFFRNPHPETPTTGKEDIKTLVEQAENPVRTMELTDKEEAYSDKSMEFEYAKVKYPNAKPFFDYCTRLGVGHMYFKNGCFICQISGKITATKGYLGLINKNNIKLALNKLQGKYISFNKDKFMEKAQVLLVHVTNDIKVTDVNSNIKAFSSFLPVRTDKFSVLKYGNSGYEILPRGKQSAGTAKHSMCIYAKAGEIAQKEQTGYKKVIGNSGERIANKTMEFWALKK